jgi:hypothetical protein
VRGRWVLDTSPLLFLAKIDRLQVLRAAADELLVSPAVWEEIQARDDDATELVRGAIDEGWLELSAPDRPTELVFQLGTGESEAIGLARERGADRVVMDDLRARRVARQVGLLPIGTLGILLAARLRGEIPSLRAEIQKLQTAGFRVSPALVEAVLRNAGEL